MSETTTISDFLLARIAEAEAAAVAVTTDAASGRDYHGTGWFGVDYNGMENEEHGRRWNPARVLAECEAKRQIVELHAIQVERDRQSPFDPNTGAERSEWAVDLYCDVCGWVSVACDTLRALASVYADHPDYRQEWRL